MLVEAPRQIEGLLPVKELVALPGIMADSIRPGILALRESVTSLAETVSKNITRLKRFRYSRGGRRSRCSRCFGKHNSLGGECKGGGVLPKLNLSNSLLKATI